MGYIEERAGCLRWVNRDRGFRLWRRLMSAMPPLATKVLRRRDWSRRAKRRNRHLWTILSRSKRRRAGRTYVHVGVIRGRQSPSYRQQLGRQLFEPDEFLWRCGHRVNTLKYFLHVWRRNEVLYGLNFRRCHLPDNVNSVAIVGSAQKPPTANFWRRVCLE
jgi:hypothetical protein